MSLPTLCISSVTTGTILAHGVTPTLTSGSLSPITRAGGAGLLAEVGAGVASLPLLKPLEADGTLGFPSLQHQPPGVEDHLAPGQLQSEQAKFLKKDKFLQVLWAQPGDFVNLGTQASTKPLRALEACMPCSGKLLRLQTPAVLVPTEASCEDLRPAFSIPTEDVIQEDRVYRAAWLGIFPSV